MTFSSPVALETVSVNPATSVWGVVAARSRFTPPLARLLKSSESVSASAASMIVTLADSVPVKTYASFPAAPERIALPVQALSVNVFALLPAVRFAPSMPASVSLPTPVSVVGVSVKSTSADSTTVSIPSPPAKASFPAPPVKVSSPPRPASVSSPARPASVLSRELPRTASANAVPTTFSIPVALDSATVNPATSVWAVVTARSRFTPPLRRLEKSSASVSASSASTMVTLADAVPEKT